MAMTQLFSTKDGSDFGLVQDYGHFALIHDDGGVLLTNEAGQRLSRFLSEVGIAPFDYLGSTEKEHSAYFDKTVALVKAYMHKHGENETYARRAAAHAEDGAAILTSPSL